MKEVSKQYENSIMTTVDATVRGRLLAWLINHVIAEDQRIADYALKKGMNGND